MLNIQRSACGFRGGRSEFHSPLGPSPRQHLHLPRSSPGEPYQLSHTSEESLVRLKKSELQDRARAAGLPTSGTKAELAARLAAKQSSSSGASRAPVQPGRPGERTMEDAMRSGPLAQALSGALRSQLGQGLSSGSIVITPGGGFQLQQDGQKLGDQGSGNGNGPCIDLLDPFTGKSVLEALGEKLGMQQSKNGGDPSTQEKWIGEVSVIQIEAKPKSKAKGQKPDEELKLQVLIRVVGKSRQEVEAALQEEASRDRGAGKSTVVGNVWKESDQEDSMTELLSARYA